MELDKKGICKMSDIEWIENNIRFLKGHSFYTDYAKTKYDEQKQLNLILFEKRLQKKNNQAGKT